MYEFEIPSVKDETEDETTKRESRYKDEIISCLKKADEKVNLKTIEDYIKLNMKDWFNNPELFKTLNYLGEPK